MIKDKIDNSSCIAPRMNIKDKKFHDTKVYEDNDKCDYYEEEVGIFSSELLHQSIFILNLN